MVISIFLFDPQGQFQGQNIGQRSSPQNLPKSQK